MYTCLFLCNRWTQMQGCLLVVARRVFYVSTKFAIPTAFLSLGSCGHTHMQSLCYAALWFWPLTCSAKNSTCRETNISWDSNSMIFRCTGRRTDGDSQGYVNFVTLSYHLSPRKVTLSRDSISTKSEDPMFTGSLVTVHFVLEHFEILWRLPLLFWPQNSSESSANFTSISSFPDGRTDHHGRTNRWRNSVSWEKAT